MLTLPRSSVAPFRERYSTHRPEKAPARSRLRVVTSQAGRATTRGCERSTAVGDATAAAVWRGRGRGEAAGAWRGGGRGERRAVKARGERACVSSPPCSARYARLTFGRLLRLGGRLPPRGEGARLRFSARASSAGGALRRRSGVARRCTRRGGGGRGGSPAASLCTTLER